MGTCLKLGMVTLTMVTFTTKISAVQDPSADDVEALKKQNAEQQQRLEKLSGELDRIKKLLEEKGISPRGQSSGEKPLTSGLNVALYGYVKLDAAYDSSRISAGNFARWVESEQIRRDGRRNVFRIRPVASFQNGGIVNIGYEDLHRIAVLPPGEEIQ